MDKQQLIDGLNLDLANEYAAVLQYGFQSAVVKGPFRTVMKELFTSEMSDELRHAQLLSEKIVALGGTPTTEPAQVDRATELSGMLQANLAAEEDTIRRYKERAGQADQVGEVALKVELENLLTDESRHADELRRVIEGM